MKKIRKIWEPRYCIHTRHLLAAIKLWVPLWTEFCNLLWSTSNCFPPDFCDHLVCNCQQRLLVLNHHILFCHLVFRALIMPLSSPPIHYCWVHLVMFFSFWNGGFIKSSVLQTSISLSLPSPEYDLWQISDWSVCGIS